MWLWSVFTKGRHDRKNVHNLWKAATGKGFRKVKNIWKCTKAHYICSIPEQKHSQFKTEMQ